MSVTTAPYRFVRIDRITRDNDNTDAIVWFIDRKKERCLPLSAVRWVRCTGPGQMVVSTSGTNRKQRYLTIAPIGDDSMLCRMDPKVPNEPSVTLRTSSLAQVIKLKGA